MFTINLVIILSKYQFIKWNGLKDGPPVSHLKLLIWNHFKIKIRLRLRLALFVPQQGNSLLTTARDAKENNLKNVYILYLTSIENLNLKNRNWQKQLDYWDILIVLL